MGMSGEVRVLRSGWEELAGIPSDVTFRTMFNHQTTLRVRYAETDRMGYVYYGTYAQYFEVGRVEALRSLGMSYRRMEEEGVMLSVHDLAVSYHRPAFYDDELTVRTSITAMPTVRIKFAYEVRNAAGELITEASTTLVFIDRATGRPCRAPEELMGKLAPYFP
jgi:acyl-CoA thioester hydrolase